MIDGRTRLLGVLGNPVSHSQSPQIHNFAIQQLNMNHCYVPLHYQGDDLSSLLRSLWQLGFVGVNVTLPYKEAVAGVLSTPLNAVNTLYRRDADYWQCQSTDGIGFIRSVARILPWEKLEQVVILGNGGAVQSLIAALHHDYPRLPFTILRRSPEKDKQIATAISSPIDFRSFTENSLKEAVNGKYTLLIQGTSAPVYGHDLKELVPALQHLQGGYSDLCYGYPSALLDEARRLGIPHQDGLGMLIEQAREAQLLWWGKTVSYDRLLRHLHSLSPA